MGINRWPIAALGSLEILVVGGGRLVATRYGSGYWIPFNIHHHLTIMTKKNTKLMLLIFSGMFVLAAVVTFTLNHLDAANQEQEQEALAVMQIEDHGIATLYHDRRHLYHYQLVTLWSKQQASMPSTAYITDAPRDLWTKMIPDTLKVRLPKLMKPPKDGFVLDTILRLDILQEPIQEEPQLPSK